MYTCCYNKTASQTPKERRSHTKGRLRTTEKPEQPLTERQMLGKCLCHSEKQLIQRRIGHKIPEKAETGDSLEAATGTPVVTQKRASQNPQERPSYTKSLSEPPGKALVTFPATKKAEKSQKMLKKQTFYEISSDKKS